VFLQIYNSGKIVRDASIHSKFEAVEARDGYYLRPRVSGESHVDHVCECQFIGHAVVQSPAFQAGGGAGILAAIDVTHAANAGHCGLNSQLKNGVAYNALRPLFNIQVCNYDYCVHSQYIIFSESGILYFATQPSAVRDSCYFQFCS
jgi:hypothetical protein